MTKARLGALCGGPPTKTAKCRWCPRTVGPYYSESLCRDAMSEHVRWQHTSLSMVGTATDEIRRAS